MRPTLLAALAVTLATPTIAAADPQVPPAELTESTRTLKLTETTLIPTVRTLDLDKFILPLEEERTTGSKVTVRISADVLFDFNSSDLTKTARTTLTKLAPRLRAARGTVQISGHSDAKGSPSYNLALSRKRAEAVKAVLQSLTGPPLTFEATGHGETKPVAPNKIGKQDNPEGRAKNRRVDITFEKP